MRIFSNKWFHRWADKQGIPSDALCRTAREVIDGVVEADLGGGLFKKRIARPGKGKRGGYRVLIGFKRPNLSRVIFLYAFAKNQRANISENEKTALRLVADSFVSATDAQISELIGRREIKELDCHE